MFVGEVIGTVVATMKVESLRGVKLLIVQPFDDEMNVKGEPVVAVDAVGAGVGERVLCVLGKEAGMALDDAFTPVDVAIVGLVDAVVKG